MVKIPHDRLSHMVFLSEVVLTGNKRKALMGDTLHMLLYLVKSIREVEIPASVEQQLEELLNHIELQLKEENEKKRQLVRKTRKKPPSERDLNQLSFLQDEDKPK
jgi:DNA-binding LytR/AlgR family response regulator